MDFTNCLKRYITKIDDITKKPIKNIANYGLLATEKAKIMRNGEYNGVEIEAIDNILPLFTTHNISKAYELLIEEKYLEIIQLLKISKEYEKYGNNVVDFIIKKWSEFTHIKIPPNIKTDIDIDDIDLIERIKLNRSNEILGKFKIIGIGKNTNTGMEVLPEIWFNKEFNSGKDLHNQMNLLSNRKGYPPVTYCCIYDMIITTIDTQQWKPFDQNTDFLKKYDYVLKMDINKIFEDNNKFYMKTKLLSIKCLTKEFNLDQYLVIVTPQSLKCIKLLILVHNCIFIRNSKNKTKNSTSYLSSLLQKCFRTTNRSFLLSETIDKLHYSIGYNLPDQHFARVSGCRQLCWRSFISIIEDITPFETTTPYQFDLLDLFSLAYISHIDPNIMLCEEVLMQLKQTLLQVQTIKESWNWKNGENKLSDVKFDDIVKNICVENNPLNRITNSLLLSLVMMPMMRNDFIMISKSIDFLKTFKLIKLDNVHITKKIDEYFDTETKMCAMDMHCMPSILIQLQGSIPFLPTKNKIKYCITGLSKFIWENSSGINTRHNTIYNLSKFKIKGKNDLCVLRALYDIQYQTIKSETLNINHRWLNNNYTESKIKKNPNKTCVNENSSRLAFLLIFGKKYKINKKINGKQYDIIICGDNEKICKVKKNIDKSKMVYIEEKERFIIENDFLTNFSSINDFCNIKILNPPIGFNWITKLIKNKSCKLGAKYENNMWYFCVDDIKIKPFDGSCLIEKIESEKIYELPDELEEMLNVIFYNDFNCIYGNSFDVLMELFKIAEIRKKNKDFKIFEWIHLLNNELFESFLYIRSRIIMAKSESIGTINIGPVDRSGKRTQNNVSDLYEGVIWRFIIALSVLYPNVIIRITPYRFKLNIENYGYIHLMESLDTIITNNKKNNKIVRKKINLTLKTKLWNHQEKSINKIMYDIKNFNKKGFGDASDVGSGKTLTAIGAMINILHYHNSCKNNSNINNSGFLVMLPSEKLYQTWIDEIKKHTNGFHIIEQQSNGSLTSDTNNNILIETILITTMARCRENPIIHPWLFVIIDECLTVQNKEAQQTEEAWRQSSFSLYGVLMLSATFFRSRFEKMLYMLSMLNTGIPEKSDYLDTILSESIICNLNEKERKWITNINFNFLQENDQKKYNTLVSKYNEIGFEKVYHMLVKFIKENVNYIEIFIDTINLIIKQRNNAKILIYANSKNEADKIAEKNNDIGRYPDIKKTHVVVSYSEGSFGLNNLIEFDTILTRPPLPDLLPQIKGRLDRPGQKKSTLHIEYILLKNTIEDADLYKLEIVNNFYGQHILPLAEYYKIAVYGFNINQNNTPK